MRRIISLACLLGVSCTSSGIGVTDLPRFVLARAPRGMVVADDAGTRTLEDLTRGDPDKRARYEEAGFRGAYQAIFEKDPASDVTPQGLRLISGAVLFDDPLAGLEAIRQTILDEGDPTQLAPLRFAPTSYVAKGSIDLGLPPGYLLVWPHDEVIMFVAAVAFGDLSEKTLRNLAADLEDGAP